MDKLNYLKMKNFCSSKHTVKKMKGHPRYGNLHNTEIQRNTRPEYIKQITTINQQERQSTQQESGQRSEQVFHQMVQHMERWSVSLVRRKCKLKP